jgi:CRISPR-associated protein Csd1
LLIDKPSYAIGLPDGKKNGAAETAEREHCAYVGLLQEAARASGNPALTAIQNVVSWGEARDKLARKLQARSGDLVSFQCGSGAWPTDDPEVQRFWSEYIEKRLGEDRQNCVVCGSEKPITRILPFKVKLFQYSAQLSSFNEEAFCSAGKTTIRKKGETKSASNAAFCYSCGSIAGQVLQHLLKLDPDRPSGRHAVILCRDDGKGQGKQPLRNQIAIFWTKELVEIDTQEGPRLIEDMNRLAMEASDDVPDDGPPAHASQIRALLESPLKGGTANASLAANRFYLAVLSPNKSRLVVREWLEQDVDPTRRNLRRYCNALQIIHPDGRGVWFPPLWAVLEALQSPISKGDKNKEKPRLPQVEPDLMRKLVRCMYVGTPPPAALLTRAVSCFRIPDPPTDDRHRPQRERQMLRRMALAAAMKLVLTHGKGEKEQQAMEELVSQELSDYKRRSPYLCGQMLAILEAVQRRASSSGRGVNTTLVDRFYGAASTAPASVFATLINMATKAHLPKLRREGKEHFRTRHPAQETININELLTTVCDQVNEAGGFPPPLTPEEQAQFALGFYHQRAELNPPKQP